MRAGATLDQNNNDTHDKYQRQSERCETQMTKEVVHLRPSCMSPFSVLTVHEWWPNSTLAGRLFRWLEESCDEDITGVWFKHDKPTPIEISAKEFKIHVSRGGILRADLCSALIRLYQQLDAKMNTNPSGQRWRHIFPPQFAKALMFEPNFSSMKAVSDMFDQHINGYKIQNCQLLISSVQLASCTWACYIWDMEKRQMHIMDPVLQRREISDVSAKHRQTVTMIHTGLLTCINKFFDDCDINPDGWTCTYYTKISPRCQRWNSGFYTLYYAREFYAGKLSNILDSGSIAALRRDIFYQLLTMEGNYAQLPSHIARYLE